MRAYFLEPAEVAELINGRKHWLVCFGREAIDLIDRLDAFLGIDPSCPTVFINLTPVTVIPKARVSWRKLSKFFKTEGKRSPDQDILVLSHDPDEGMAIMAAVRRAGQLEQPNE